MLGRLTPLSRNALTELEELFEGFHHHHRHLLFPSRSAHQRRPTPTPTPPQPPPQRGAAVSSFPSESQQTTGPSSAPLPTAGATRGGPAASVPFTHPDPSSHPLVHGRYFDVFRDPYTRRCWRHHEQMLYLVWWSFRPASCTECGMQDAWFPNRNGEFKCAQCGVELGSTKSNKVVKDFDTTATFNPMDKNSMIKMGRLGTGEAAGGANEESDGEEETNGPSGGGGGDSEEETDVITLYTLLYAWLQHIPHPEPSLHRSTHTAGAAGEASPTSAAPASPSSCCFELPSGEALPDILRAAHDLTQLLTMPAVSNGSGAADATSSVVPLASSLRRFHLPAGGGLASSAPLARACALYLALLLHRFPVPFPLFVRGGAGQGGEEADALAADPMSPRGGRSTPQPSPTAGSSSARQALLPMNTVAVEWVDVEMAAFLTGVPLTDFFDGLQQQPAPPAPHPKPSAALHNESGAADEDAGNSAIAERYLENVVSVAQAAGARIPSLLWDLHRTPGHRRYLQDVIAARRPARHPLLPPFPTLSQQQPVRGPGGASSLLSLSPEHTAMAVMLSLARRIDTTSMWALGVMAVAEAERAKGRSHKEKKHRKGIAGGQWKETDVQQQQQQQDHSTPPLPSTPPVAPSPVAVPSHGENEGDGGGGGEQPALKKRARSRTPPTTTPSSAATTPQQRIKTEPGRSDDECKAVPPLREVELEEAAAFEVAERLVLGDPKRTRRAWEVAAHFAQRMSEWYGEMAERPPEEGLGLVYLGQQQVLLYPTLANFNGDMDAFHAALRIPVAERFAAYLASAATAKPTATPNQASGEEGDHVYFTDSPSANALLFLFTRVFLLPYPALDLADLAVKSGLYHGPQRCYACLQQAAMRGNFSLLPLARRLTPVTSMWLPAYLALHSSDRLPFLSTIRLLHHPLFASGALQEAVLQQLHQVLNKYGAIRFFQFNYVLRVTDAKEKSFNGYYFLSALHGEQGVTIFTCMRSGRKTIAFNAHNHTISLNYLNERERLVPSLEMHLLPSGPVIAGVQGSTVGLVRDVSLHFSSNFSGSPTLQGQWQQWVAVVRLMEQLAHLRRRMQQPNQASRLDALASIRESLHAAPAHQEEGGATERSWRAERRSRAGPFPAGSHAASAVSGGGGRRGVDWGGPSEYDIIRSQPFDIAQCREELQRELLPLRANPRLLLGLPDARVVDLYALVVAFLELIEYTQQDYALLLLQQQQQQQGADAGDEGRRSAGGEPRTSQSLLLPPPPRATPPISPAVQQGGGGLPLHVSPPQYKNSPPGATKRPTPTTGENRRGQPGWSSSEVPPATLPNWVEELRDHPSQQQQQQQLESRWEAEDAEQILHSSSSSSDTSSRSDDDVEEEGGRSASSSSAEEGEEPQRHPPLALHALARRRRVAARCRLTPRIGVLPGPTRLSPRPQQHRAVGGGRLPAHRPGRAALARRLTMTPIQAVKSPTLEKFEPLPPPLELPPSTGGGAKSSALEEEGGQEGMTPSSSSTRRPAASRTKGGEVGGGSARRRAVRHPVGARESGEDDEGGAAETEEGGGGGGGVPSIRALDRVRQLKATLRSFRKHICYAYLSAIPRFQDVMGDPAAGGEEAGHGLQALQSLREQLVQQAAAAQEALLQSRRCPGPAVSPRERPPQQAQPQLFFPSLPSPPVSSAAPLRGSSPFLPVALEPFTLFDAPRCRDRLDRLLRFVQAYIAFKEELLHVHLPVLAAAYRRGLQQQLSEDEERGPKPAAGNSPPSRSSAAPVDLPEPLSLPPSTQHQHQHQQPSKRRRLGSSSSSLSSAASGEDEAEERQPQPYVRSNRETGRKRRRRRQQQQQQQQQE